MVCFLPIFDLNGLIIYFSDIGSTNDLIETIEYFKRLLEETRVSKSNT